MATSTDQLPSDMNPDIRPDFKQGDQASDKAVSADGLKSAEAKPSDGSGTTGQSLGSGKAGSEKSGPKDDSPFNFRKEPAKAAIFKLSARDGGKKKKGLLLGLGLAGGGVLGVILILLILLFGFLGSLKYVHFATVLRTVAFAQFTNTMRQTYAQTVFDAAVLDPSSTGSFDMDSIGSRNIVDLIKGINPQAQLQELGTAGDMKFLFNESTGFLGRTTNSFEGVTIRNPDTGVQTTYNVNQYAKAYGQDSYDSLSPLQQIKVRNTISSDLRTSLYDNLGLSSRDTTAALKGLQAAFDFKLVGFTDFARSFLGKSTEEAQVEAEKESYDEVQGVDATAPDITSENSEANSDAEILKSEITTQLNDGQSPNLAQDEADADGSAPLADAASDANKIAGITLVLVGYCTINDLRNSAQQADMTNQTDAVRQAALIQSRKDQIETGDVNATAVGGATASFNGAQNSSLYQADTGATVTGTPSDLNEVPTLDSFDILTSGPVNTAFNALTDAIFLGANHIPIVGGVVTGYIRDKVCTAVLNPVGQIGLAIGGILVDIGTDGGGEAAGSLADAFSNGVSRVLTSPDGAQEFITQGAKFAGTYELFNLAGSWLQSYIQKLDGLDYSGLAQGSSLYDQGSVGTQYMAQSSSRTVSYGRPLSNGEATQSQGVALASVKKTLNSGLYNRYFSIDNPFSLLGSIVADMPSSFTDMADDIQSAIPSFISKFGSFLMNPSELLSLLPGRSAEAQAAGSASLEAEYNYFGVQQWGWTQAELNTIENDPSYSLVANTNYVAGNPTTFTQLNNEFMPCYASSVQYTPGDASSTPSYCTSAYLSTTDALHWRKYMLDQYILTQMSSPLPAGTTAAAGAQ